jgi:hypothetical protein
MVTTHLDGAQRKIYMIGAQGLLMTTTLNLMTTTLNLRERLCRSCAVEPDGQAQSDGMPEQLSTVAAAGCIGALLPGGHSSNRHVLARF